MHHHVSYLSTTTQLHLVSLISKKKDFIHQSNKSKIVFFFQSGSWYHITRFFFKENMFVCYVFRGPEIITTRLGNILRPLHDTWQPPSLTRRRKIKGSMILRWRKVWDSNRIPPASRSNSPSWYVKAIYSSPLQKNRQDLLSLKAFTFLFSGCLLIRRRRLGLFSAGKSARTQLVFFFLYRADEAYEVREALFYYIK